MYLHTFLYQSQYNVFCSYYLWLVFIHSLFIITDKDGRVGESCKRIRESTYTSVTKMKIMYSSKDTEIQQLSEMYSDWTKAECTGTYVNYAVKLKLCKIFIKKQEECKSIISVFYPCILNKGITFFNEHLFSAGWGHTSEPPFPNPTYRLRSLLV